MKKTILQIPKIASNEKGMVLVLALLLISALALLGSTAVITTTTDIKISANNKTGNQAFYVAEAGVEEARARMRGSPSTNPNYLADSFPTDTGWQAYIGAESKAQGKGYSSGNSKHVRVASLQSALDYTVKIVHKTNSAGNMLYWGECADTSNPKCGDGIPDRTTSPTNPAGLPNKIIYLVSSYGVAGNASKTIEAEISRAPTITAPAALYVESITTLQGTSTNVIGVDRCGGPTNLPGVLTTLAPGTVSSTGQPKVCGATQICCGFSPYPACGSTAPWDVVGNGKNMDIQSVVDSWKSSADYKYSVSGDTQNGMHWGTPTLAPAPDALQKPSSCSVSNVVYYNTNGTDIKLAGGTTGCGLLLVDGDLEVNGGFSWYGMVIVTGSVRYLGGGDKNITGAVLVGGSLDADLVGGNANIVYCSSAINNLSENQPLRRLSWKEQNI